MLKPNRTIKTDTVFSMMVFCIFAASVLVVLMLGASIYKSTVEKSQEAYNERTSLSYIWSKVKNTDEYGRVYVGDFHGMSSLYLDEDYGGTIYSTIIYFYNGWIYELFSEKGIELYPEDGTRIIEAEALDFRLDEKGVISVNSGSLLIYPHARKGIVRMEGGHNE